jgi:hypothetical protein
MTHDQIPLFAASTVLPTVPLPARPKLTRKPARAAATHEASAEALSLPLVTSLTERPLAKRAPTETHLPMPTEQDTTPTPSEADNEPVALRTDRLWQLDGWTARVIKNEDDDGWAVEMLQDGESEPALVGPWTMGRDKKNPKPLDQAAFSTLVKTASEVLQRHVQQAHAMLHKRLTVFALDAQWEVRLDITPDEYEPYATLSAFDEAGVEIAQVRVPPDFRFGVASATAWITSDFARPAAARGSASWGE